MATERVFVTNIVTINAVDYRLTSLSYDGTWWNVIKTTTGERTYLNADTVEYIQRIDESVESFPAAPEQMCYVL